MRKKAAAVFEKIDHDKNGHVTSNDIMDWINKTTNYNHDTALTHDEVKLEMRRWNIPDHSKINKPQFVDFFVGMIQSMLGNDVKYELN